MSEIGGILIIRIDTINSVGIVDFARSEAFFVEEIARFKVYDVIDVALFFVAKVLLGSGIKASDKKVRSCKR